MKITARAKRKPKAPNTTRPKYAWWIEPIDDITNHAIADELPSSNIELIEIKGGSEKRAWSCDSDLIHKLKKAMRTSQLILRYYVYNRRGQGQIRRVPIFEPK